MPVDARVREGYFFGRACACAPPTSWWRDDAERAARDAADARRRAPALLNTFTKTKVPFKPLSGNSVGWYICGPTVYDSAHVGHARNYVNFDVLRRVMMEYFGYDVRFVMNVTDIDDKIIMRAHTRRAEAVVKAARETGETRLGAETLAVEKLLAEGGKPLGALDSATRTLANAVKAAIGGGIDAEHCCAKDWTIQDGYLTLAHQFEAEFMEDMKSLGVARPDMLTRVSEYVDKVILYIQVIINKGFAYESNGSVYFDVKAFEAAENHKYGKLNQNAMENITEAMDGEGALEAEKSEKKCDFDFVLWKMSKDGEPCWSSPWGMGRPGWHIECSAMCSDILGQSVDINGGGIDLNFPHHENQLAQSEAHYDTEQWVNFFIHTGHLHIDGLKMSKSLKNFITIRAALKMYSARQIRFLFLLNQWCDPMELTPVAAPDGSGVIGFKQMDLALSIERLFVEFFHSIKGVFRTSGSYHVDKQQTWNERERELSDALDTSQAAVHEALIDNINTPNTLLALQDLVKATNKYLAETGSVDVRPLLLERVGKFVTKILNCLGVCLDTGAVGFPESSEGSSEGREETLSPFLDLMTKFRDDIRKLAQGGASAKELLTACDNLRDVGLPELGVKLDDKEGGALWKLYDADELKKEIAREHEAKEEKERAKRAAKEEAARKAAEKEARAKVPPSEMFKTFSEYEGLYSKYDDDGVPTHDAAGEALAKSAAKKLLKSRQQQEKAHETYLAKAGMEKLAV
jgi:cysteinyl-tRNA synthetase